MSKLIILNGPKGCGKSDLTQYIKQSHNKLVLESRCKDRLFDLTASIFGLSESEFLDIYNDRATKETPLPDFSVTAKAFRDLCAVLKTDSVPYERAKLSSNIYLSVRSAMIYVSECVVKPMFGDNYFGVCRAEALESDSGTIYIDDSALGTMDEIKPAMDVLGTQNVVFVRIYGRGDFSSDSRKYFDDKDIPEGSVVIDLDNSSDEEEFLTNAMAKIWEAV